MLRTLDAYRCSIAFLPLAFAIAQELDGEMASRLRRAALSLSIHIAEVTGGVDQRKFLIAALESALECAAVLDAMTAVGIADDRVGDGEALLVRVVSTLTEMIG